MKLRLIATIGFDPMIYFSFLLITRLMPMVMSGDISELCDDDKPIDAAVRYSSQTFYLIKKSNVWRCDNISQGAERIDGPRPLKEVFDARGQQELESIDALFHINANPPQSPSSNDTSYGYMVALALVFSKDKYYIYAIAPDNKSEIVKSKYYGYLHTVGVPSGLTTSGSIASFISKDTGPIDSALFDRAKNDVVVTAGTNAYVLSQFTQKGKNSRRPTKKSINEIFGVNRKIYASMDINNNGEVILIFEKTYCQINLTKPSCKEKSIRSWFKCPQLTKTKTTRTTKNPSKVQSNTGKGDDTSLSDSGLVVFIILFAIIFVLIGTSLALFFVIKAIKAGASSSTTTSRSKASKTLSSGPAISRASSVKPQETTFSTAFGPKK